MAVTIQPPPFTLSDVKATIPEHCFERSTLKSFSYLIRDLVFAFLLFEVAIFTETLSSTPYWWTTFFLWPLYWFWQGVVLTGIWVIAHECGHQAFSPSSWINNSVGLVLHSSLLVPYFSWKISHAKHHIATGNLERDEVHLPKNESKVEALTETPIANLFGIVSMLLFGWPAYLLFHATGRDYGRHTDHFQPSSPIFDAKQFWQIITSDVGIFLMLGLLGYSSYVWSVGAVIRFYGIPYLFVNGWLVLYTYLHHTDTYVPYYRGSEWNFLRGALSTVDRNYGIFDYFHHDIGNTHVCHHIFSRMPHYHSIEATESMTSILGKYYLKDETPFFKALWRVAQSCQCVDDTGDVVFYKKKVQTEKNKNL